MKKLGCVVLAWIMVLAMCTTVSAATMQDASAYVPNPLEMELAVAVGARNGVTEDAYTPSLPLYFQTNQQAGVDYQATLDMKPIRDLFDEGFITTMLAMDEELRTEFNSGVVTTTVQAAISYPAAARITKDLTKSDVGVLEADSIFSETGRTVSENESDKTKTLTITYVNRADLTAGELTENKDTYLSNIKFTLNDTVAYGTAGTHTVYVTLYGKTEIKFATKTQVIEYVGGASHIVTCAVDTLEHVLRVVPAVPATCTTKGWTEGIICETHGNYGVQDGEDGCYALGTLIPEEKPALGHPEQKISFSEVEATCGATGMKAHETCPLCKTDFVGGEAVLHDSLIIPITEPHTPVPVEAKAATCTQSGLTEGSVCSVCGLVLTVQKATFKEHEPETVAAVEPTCTENGWTEGIKCKACGKTIQQQTAVPAKGHSFGEWTVTSQPSETATGMKERICANGCGTKETVEIPKVAHTCVAKDELAAITKAPTCTETGLKQNYCACGKTVGAPVSVPATGHKTSRVAAEPATCIETGIVEHYACVNCNGNFRDAEGKNALKDVTAPVDRGNHGGNVVKIPGVAPTCVKEGLKEGSKCRACDTVITPQGIAPKVDHTLETVDEEAATCEKDGMEAHQHCGVCNKDFSMDGKTEHTMAELRIPAVAHIWREVKVTEGKEPTEDADGEGTRTCENCGHVKTVKIAKLEHDHNETVEEITEAVTCTKSGKKRIIYSCCGGVVEINGVKQEGIEIPSHGHTPELVPSVPATCHTEGVGAYYKCTECRKLFSSADMTKEIQKPATLGELTHDWQTMPESDGKHTVKKCRHCGEVVNTKKETDRADVRNHGGMKDDKDRLREEIVDNVRVETDINIVERDEVSNELHDEIQKGAEGAKEEKVVLDIVVEKVTTYGDGEQDKEVVSETPELIEIEITIPAELRNLVSYIVYRLHDGKTEALTTAKNDDGEYIELDLAKNKIILHVKKFSEYALVGYDKEVDPTPPTTPTTSTSKPSVKTYTVSFRANGGTVVDSVQVKSGSTVTAPETTREGYVFAGWYTDSTFTKLFDFSAPIKSHTTLYAKWLVKTDDNTIILTIGDETATVYGKEVENDVAPKIVNSRTMLPIRFVAESLGATVGWEEATRTVSIKLGETNIQLVVGETKAIVNGNEVALDVASFIENDRTYLPLRFVAENLGAAVEWEEATQKVTITAQRPNNIILTIGEKTAIVFGEKVENDVAPQLVNNRTMLPIRFVAESLGATVGWEEATQTVSIQLGDIDIKLTVGEAKATVGGSEVALDVASFIENSRTYLPLRFVAENLGATVEWEEAIQTVVITKNE